jgi:hypothetical protein
MFKLQGTIKVIKDTQQVSDKFSKREMIVTTPDDKYPQDIMLELQQDHTSLLDAFMEGQEVEVSFDIRGREWTSPTGDVKYFNTLKAFRVEAIGAAPAKPKPVKVVAEVFAEVTAEAEDDDLPF